MAAEGKWTTGLYDFWEDSSLCLLAACCPCYVFGEIAEIVDAGTTPKKWASCIYCLGGPAMSWLMGSIYRKKLRRLFLLPEEPYSDYVLHLCCFDACSLTQEYKELKNRGIDLSIGWQGNEEKWKREGVEPPISIPTMTR